MSIRNINGCVCNVTTFSGKMQKHASAGYVSAARTARSMSRELNGKDGKGLMQFMKPSFRVARRNADGSITVLK